MSTRSFSFSNDNPLSTEAVLVNASSSRYEEDWPSIPHTHAFTELFYVSEEAANFLQKISGFPLPGTIWSLSIHISCTRKLPRALRPFLIILSEWMESVFLSVIRRNSRFSTAGRLIQIFCFISTPFFRNQMRKKRIMKRFADTRFPFLLPSFAG